MRKIVALQGTNMEANRITVEVMGKCSMGRLATYALRTLIQRTEAGCAPARLSFGLSN